MTTELEQLIKIRGLLADIKSLLTANPPPNDESNSLGSAGLGDNPTPANWADYLEQKQPKNDYEIIALVVGYLTQGNKQSVTKDEIIEFLRKNPKRIKNTTTLSTAINAAKNKKHYRYIEFISNDDKAYRLSIRGEQLVSELPNRIEVPKKKKTGKKRK